MLEKEDILGGRTIEELHAEMQQKLIEIRPEATRVILEIYNSSDNQRTKQDIALTVFSKVPPQEIADAIKKTSVNINELVKDANRRIKYLNNIKVAQRRLAQERRHERRQDYSLTNEEWRATCSYFNDKCAYCGADGLMTYDHFIPFSKGGSFTKDNIVPACSFCNSSKNNSFFDEWYPKQEFFNEDNEKKISEFVKKYR